MTIDKDAFQANFRAFALKMEAQGLSPLVVNIFKNYYAQLISGDLGKLSEADVLPVADEEVVPYESLEPYADAGRAAMRQAVVIKLNGGLGTSMGLEKAKSLIAVKDGLSFLEIILRQIEDLRESFGASLPLVLMNSFKTHVDSMLQVEFFDNGETGLPLAFVQNKFPKVLQKNYMPAFWPTNPELEWNPPGHGDIYTSLVSSGMLALLLKKGIVYAFISNSDNLGAVMDPRLLGYLAAENLPFVMETATRTQADKKGGHLTRLKRNGRLALREIAQCPDDELDQFADIDKHRYFNTNSLWINLRALDQIFVTRHMMPLDMIVNPKTLDPRDPESPPVFQIETAMGGAVGAFEGARAVLTPRSRFAPVKTTSDLLLVMSDLYRLTPEHHVTPVTPDAPLPKVSLDPKYYKKIDEFGQRFPHGAPSLTDCASFVVEGNVKFDKQIVARGDVHIKNTSPTQVLIPKGALLEGPIVLP